MGGGGGVSVPWSVDRGALTHRIQIEGPRLLEWAQTHGGRAGTREVTLGVKP